MRIRKHAAKLLLGSACPPQHSPPPPPPAVDEYDQQSVADHGSLFLCQLNCSPWDVPELDSNHFYFHHQQEAAGEDEGKGIMGNLLGFGDEEGIFGISEAITKSSSVVVAEPYIDCGDEDDSDEKKKVKKKRRRRKKKNEVENEDDDVKDKEKTSSVVTVIAKSGGGAGTGTTAQAPGICKKNDGKGWHCNRPANPYHTLCDHHLTQLKSYSSTRHNSNNNIAAAGRGGGGGGEVVESEPNAARVAKNHNKTGHAPPPVKHRRRKTKSAAAATSEKSDGDGYYYYSGFGLSRGKSRSNGRKEDPKVKGWVEEEEEVSAGMEGHNVSRSGDASDAPIAGGDLDDDTDEDDGDDNKNLVGNVDNNKGRIQRKKRGRKPIKARSLKSLL